MRPEPAQPDPKQQRRTGRIAPEGVQCDLGTVLDLSAGGVKLSGKGHPPGDVGDKLSLRLDWGMGKLDFEGVITRVEKRLFFGWVMGVKFENLTTARKQSLSKAAMLAASGEITQWSRAS